METGTSRLVSIIHLLIDLLIFNAAYWGGGVLRYQDQALEILQYEYYQQFYVAINALWLATVFSTRNYQLQRTDGFYKVFKRVGQSYLVMLLFLAAYVFIFKGVDYSRLLIGYTLAIGFSITIIIRWLTFHALRRYRRSGKNDQRILLVGDTPVIRSFYDRVASYPDYGYRVVGNFSAHLFSGLKQHPDSIDAITAFCNNNAVDAIICSYIIEDERIRNLATWCDQRLIRFRYLPNLHVFGARQFNLGSIAGIPVLLERKEPLARWSNAFVKRFFDLVIALVVVATIFPWFIPLVALLIKLDSTGPVFFVQERSGLKGERITCFKLRSLVYNAPNQDQQVTANDYRVTRVGKWLRKTSLDELPQFWNVLLGNMSVVGPRPHMLTHTTDFAAVVAPFMVRHFIKPGITGLAQIKGYRGEVHSRSDIEQRVFYDVEYLESWSLLLDIRIVALTIKTVLWPSDKAY